MKNEIGNLFIRKVSPATKRKLLRIARDEGFATISALMRNQIAKIIKRSQQKGKVANA